MIVAEFYNIRLLKKFRSITEKKEKERKMGIGLLSKQYIFSSQLYELLQRSHGTGTGSAKI